MPKKLKSPGETLILSLATHGGSLSLTEIVRRLRSRERLSAARKECAGLIDFSRVRGKANRPAWRVTLTLQGYAAAQALRPGFQPKRLATPVLKAWLADLQREGDPWAVGLGRAQEAAASWRAWQTKVAAWRKEEERGKKPGCPLCHRGKAKRRGRSFVGTSAPVEQPSPTPADKIPPSNAPGFGRDPIPPSTPNMLGPAPGAPSRCNRGSYCRRCTANCELCRCQVHLCAAGTSIEPTPWRPSAMPRAEQTASSDPDLDKIKQAGYSVDAAHGMVKFDNRWIPVAEWKAKMPHVRL